MQPGLLWPIMPAVALLAVRSSTGEPSGTARLHHTTFDAVKTPCRHVTSLVPSTYAEERSVLCCHIVNLGVMEREMTT